MNELDQVATTEFLRYAVESCPHCKAKPYFLKVKHYMQWSHDGLIVCDYCKKYIKTWEALPKEAQKVAQAV